MATKLRSQSSNATSTIGGSGPFLSPWVSVSNDGADHVVYVGGDDQTCNFPVRPCETVYFPIGDSEYVYFATKNSGETTTVVVAGLMTV